MSIGDGWFPSLYLSLSLSLSLFLSFSLSLSLSPSFRHGDCNTATADLWGWHPGESARAAVLVRACLFIVFCPNSWLLSHVRQKFMSQTATFGRRVPGALEERDVKLWCEQASP